MHPVLIQALAAERIRERQADVAVAGRARRAQRSLGVRLFGRTSRAAHGPVFRPDAGSLRDPRPA